MRRCVRGLGRAREGASERASLRALHLKPRSLRPAPHTPPSLLGAQIHDLRASWDADLGRAAMLPGGVGAGGLSFDEFASLYARFPVVLFPAFKIQEALQSHYFGRAWWTRKRQLFTAVRADLARKRARLARLAMVQVRAPRPEQRQPCVCVDFVCVDFAKLLIHFNAHCYLTGTPPLSVPAPYVRRRGRQEEEESLLAEIRVAAAAAFAVAVAEKKVRGALG